MVRIKICASFFFQGQLMAKSKDRFCPSPDATAVVSDRNCEKYGAALTLTSNMKSNPLFMATGSLEKINNTKMKPCWTVKEYNTQTMHWTLAYHLKVSYTEGYGGLRLTKWNK